jgi:hypothetical protein
MRVFGYIVLWMFAIVVILGLGWLIQGNDFFLYKYFAPQYEQVRRTTFEQSKAYNQGMVQELQNMQFQYVQADAAHKTALADLILHRAADYNMDDSRVPSDLRDFVAQLKRDRTSAQ